MTTKVITDLLRVDNSTPEGYGLEVGPNNTVVPAPKGVDAATAAQVQSNTIAIATLTSGSITHSVTQWSAPNWTVYPITVADNSEVLLLGVVDNATDKNAAVTTPTGALDITTHPTLLHDVIKTTWDGGTTVHTIRLNFEITAGNDQHYEVQIRRGGDNSVVASYPVSRNPDSPAVSVDLTTFTYKADDPFVTDGFYLAFVNDSGLQAQIDGAYSLTIFSSYQYLKEVV